jgi:predicted SAM-dependent methyltransferase
MKLHLGCGRYYLPGYTNIDYPREDHSLQSDIKADIYCDITKLKFPTESVDEVRLHHVFEHFPRPIALALLCRWRDWLVPGGTLRLETPDLKASAWMLAWPFTRYEDKQQVIRHLFGSHEAHWAVHYDGWYAERFVKTLRRLGFAVGKIQASKWQCLRNIEVTAYKDATAFNLADYVVAAKELLSLSTVKTKEAKSRSVTTPQSEAQMLSLWMQMWEKAYLAHD